jgi:ribosomal-protein-alanine N-acetyltransferase
MRHKDFGTGAPVAELGEGDVQLRSNVFNFAEGLASLQKENKDFLKQWTASPELGLENYSFNVYYLGDVVGQIMLWGVERPTHCNISYWVGEKFNNKGIGTTAVGLASRYSFETLGLERVEAPIQPHNFPSIRLVQKLGFSLERKIPQYMVVNGTRADHDIYVLYNRKERKEHES